MSSCGVKLNMRIITVRVPEWLYNRMLKAIREKKAANLSDLVRKAILEYLKSIEECEDV